MKRILFPFAAVVVMTAAGVDYSFIGNSDKDPLSYAIGETMTFTVTLVDRQNSNAPVSGKPLRWTLTDDGGQERSGTATSDQPLVVTHSMTNAGFTRLKVEVQSGGAWLSGNTEFFDGGAGADVWNIPEWPKPADFDTFWDNARDTLLATAYTPVLTPYRPANGSDDVDYFVYSIPTVGSDAYSAATGMIALPKCRAPHSLGIITHTFGYGYQGQIETPSTSEVLANGGNIVVHMTRWGEDPVGDDAYYTAFENANPSRGFRNLSATIQDLDQYKMHLRNLRALQYAKSRPEWNGRDISLKGGSLGGYQALCLAGLDGDVTDVNVSVPWSVDLGGVKLGRMSGWRPGWTANVDYVDAKNFAYRIAAPVTFSAGIGDYTCPPSGEVQLYRILNVPVKATFTQNMGHGSLHGPNCASYQLQKNIPAEPLHRTMRFIGGTGSWKTASNWLDVAGGTNDLPRATDIVDLTTGDSNNARNDWEDFEAYGLKLSAFNSYSASTLPITLDARGCGISDTGYIYGHMPLKLRGMTVQVSCTQLLGIANRFESADGYPFGIVKTGASIAGLCPFNVAGDYASAYRGLRSIEIREGTFAFNIQNKVADNKLYVFPNDLVVTFSGANTKLALVGNFALTNFCVRETGAAVNGVHSIGPQNASDTASLRIVGTPAVDTMNYSGTMSGKFSFTWAPDDAAKTFVFAGKDSLKPMEGDLTVENGTVRFAKSTALRKGVVAANATLAVAKAALTAAELEVAAGAHVALADGATLNALSLKVNGAAVPNGVYTGATGTFGTPVGWIEGAGTVIVGATLNWVAQAGGSGYSGAGDPDAAANWLRSDDTAALPASGDVIVLNNSLHKVALASSATFLSNTANGLGGVLFTGDGYAVGNSWSIIWGSDDIYLAAGGYIRNNVVHASQSARIWKNVVVKGGPEPLRLSSVAGGRLLLHRSVVGGTPILIEGEGVVQLIDYSHRGSGQAGMAVPHEVGANYYASYHLAVPEIRLTSGTTDFRCWYKMTNTVVRFAGNNPATTLQIGVDGAGLDLGNALWFGDGSYLAEADDVANTGHSITSAQEAYLQFQGAPGVAVQTFTGRMTGHVGLVWNPTTAAEFAFAQATSDTAGALHVSNGTVRVTNGAKFTALSRAVVAAGATLAVGGDASVEAYALDLAAGGALALGAGAKVVAKAATLGGAALAVGAYTGPEGAFGTKVGWISGAGVLQVGRSVYWRATEGTVSGSGDGGVLANWAEWDGSDLAAAATLPSGGDWIVLDNRNYTKALAPTAAFNNANKTQGLGGILFEGTGVRNNSSRAIIWGDSKLYISGDAVLSNAVNAAATTRIWANTQIVGTGAGVKIGTARADGVWWQERTLLGNVPVIVEGSGTVIFADYNVDNANTHDPLGGTYNGNYSLKVPAVEIRSGIAEFRDWYKLTNTVVRFTGAGTALVVGFGSADAGKHDLWFGNGSSLVSDPSLAVGSHVIRPSTGQVGAIHFKNTPGVADQVFTGRLTGALDFEFDPASADYTFTFSGATNDTTGALIVSNGTVRLVDGASFTRLSRLTVAAGATFATGAGASFMADEVELAAGAVFSVAAGVTLDLGRVTVNGELQRNGVYTRANAAWITGDGTVNVTGGVWDDVVWNRDDYPWTLAAGQTVYKGIDLYGANLAETDLAAPAGADVLLGPSGIVSAGAGRRYSFGWPITLAGDQTWRIGAGDRIDFTAPLATFGGARTVTAKKPASGAQYVFWAPSTATHAWLFETNLTVVLRSGTGLGTGPVTLANAQLRPCGGTVPNDIATTNIAGETQSFISSMENTGESVLAGDVKMAYAGHVQLTAGAGAPLRFTGKVSKPRGYITFEEGRFDFDRPVEFGSGAMSFGGATLYLNAATNKVGSNNFQFGSSGRLSTTVPYAMAGGHVVMNLTGSGDARWDLCGGDQQVESLKGGPYSVITSATAAVVHVTTSSSYSSDSHSWGDGAYNAGTPTNYVSFAGGAGLSVDGSGYMRLCGLSSTTGTLAVAGGGLVEMAASQYYPPDQKTYAGRWPNASRVVVSKGTLDVQHGGAFGRMVDVELGGDGTAKLQLAAGVRMKCRDLYIDGVRQHFSTYGSAQSDAKTRNDACFAGTGVLVVLGEYTATQVFFR